MKLKIRRRVDDQVGGSIELSRQAAQYGRFAATAFGRNKCNAISVNGKTRSFDSIFEALIVQN